MQANGVFPGLGVNYPYPQDVARVIHEKGVSVIVALRSPVSAEITRTWTNFANSLTPKGVLTEFDDWNKIVDIIKVQYQNSVQKSEVFVLVENSTTEHLKFNFDGGDRRAVKCSHPQENSSGGGRFVDCALNVTLDACPKNGRKNETLAFNVEGYGTMAEFEFRFICKENDWEVLGPGL